ncbi:MAG TPA: hypothetical protein VGG06_30330 [Thermoanaerobaculia bacterium]
MLAHAGEILERRLSDGDDEGEVGFMTQTPDNDLARLSEGEPGTRVAAGAGSTSAGGRTLEHPP